MLGQSPTPPCIRLSMVVPRYSRQSMPSRIPKVHPKDFGDPHRDLDQLILQSTCLLIETKSPMILAVFHHTNHTPLG